MSENKDIKIIDFEHAVGKSTGKAYCRFNTSKGWMSAFDDGVIEELKQLKGSKTSIRVKTNTKELNGKEYVNINGIIGASELEEDFDDMKDKVTVEAMNVPIEKVSPSGVRNQTQIDIIRQCCIKSACAIDNVNGEVITEIAERFEKWITR